MSTPFTRATAIAFCAILLLGFLPAFAATYTVVTTAYGTSSDGISLQWAMQQAVNTPGIDIVAFNIPGPAPKVLNVSPGFAATSDYNIIDGTTQPANGFTGTSPKIIIDCGNQSGVFVGTNFLNIKLKGIWFRNFASTVITNNGSSDSVVVSGCWFTNCATAVFVNGFNHYTRVENCLIKNSTSYGMGSNGVYNRYDILNNRFESNAGDGVFHNGIGWVHNSRGNQYVNNFGSGIGGNGSGFIYARRDWIAGNHSNGISMNGFDYTLVADSSVIGIDSLGISSMGNLQNGIFINGSSQTTFDIRHCLISANSGNGVSTNGTLDTAMFYNNYIGTDQSGILDRGNGQTGINVSGYIVVGGIGLGNVISGNGNAGIVNNGPKSIIQGNFIGTDASGTLMIPNNDDGVFLMGDSCRVGGIAAGEGNRIAFNGGDGVTVMGQNSPIRQNSIYCNQGKGINLANVGNTNYPFPILTGQGSNFVSGMANPGDTIEVFEAHACPCALQGQGVRYIGTAVANLAGAWIYNGPVPSSLVATATDSAGFNTSEFSSCAILLPQEVTFMAEAAAEHQARLWWEIPADLQVQTWQLERATDAIHFASWTDQAPVLGRVHFEQYDPYPPANTVWYRLRTFTANGESQFSEARKVEFETVSIFQAHPNPVSDHITIVLAGHSPGLARLDLIDVTGKVISLWEGSLTAARNELQLALPPLSSGLYLLRLHEDGGMQTIRLVAEQKL